MHVRHAAEDLPGLVLRVLRQVAGLDQLGVGHHRYNLQPTTITISAREELRFISIGLKLDCSANLKATKAKRGLVVCRLCSIITLAQCGWRFRIVQLIATCQMRTNKRIIP